MIKSIAIHYFDYWNSRNIEHLGELLTEDCRLQDWEIEIEGRDNIIKGNKEVFEKFPNAKILVQNIALDSTNLVAAEICIDLSSELSLNVVDILRFRDGKIYEISAFKR